MDTTTLNSLQKHTVLHRLLVEGKVIVEGSEYIGHAADGTWVNLGMVGYEKQMEAYLLTHQTPESW